MIQTLFKVQYECTAPDGVVFFMDLYPDKFNTWLQYVFDNNLMKYREQDAVSPTKKIISYYFNSEDDFYNYVLIETPYENEYKEYDLQVGITNYLNFSGYVTVDM